MKLHQTLTLLLALFGLSVYAQQTMPAGSKQLGNAFKSPIYTMALQGEINTPTADLKWKPILTKKCTGFEPQVPDEEMIEKIKTEKTKMKSGATANKNAEPSTQSVVPLIGTNFLGNTNNGSSPLDNSVAISNGGIIVSVANTTIEIDNISGTNLYYNDIATFFNDPFITNVCDPVILYDKLADRFIFFAQECSGNSSNSNLLICFSQTNNPATGGWWKYKLTGNPINNNSWFDYPKMAISNNELYIAGNLFSNAGTFNQAVLYQIDKVAGYAGNSINWQYWFGLNGSPFTLLPVSNGQGLSYTPGCYIVATEAGGASDIKLYHLTDDISGSPMLTYNSVSTTTYSPAGDAAQMGTTCLLKNGDCRTLSGFYLNGIIHFVFHSDIGSGWNGINYNRLTVSTLTNVSSTFGSVGNYDYSYPSVVSYTASATDKSVMIGFGRSSSAIYPEVRVVNCDNAMSWLNSTLVKSSSSFVSYTSTTAERWGDYTGTSRKHNNGSTPSIWVNGMFGNFSNTWDTWIAEVHDNGSSGINDVSKNNSLSVYPNPVTSILNVDFSLTENTNLEIKIVDVNSKLVKELYTGKATAGENNFSFNKANLATGTFFLIIKNETTTFKNEKIIIAN